MENCSACLVSPVNSSSSLDGFIRWRVHPRTRFLSLSCSTGACRNWFCMLKWDGAQDVNWYSEENGIMMVYVAIQLQRHEGMPARDAIHAAARLQRSCARGKEARNDGISISFRPVARK